MPDIDPISIAYLLNNETKLSFPLGLNIFEEVESKLTLRDKSVIMRDLGKYLGRLHSIKGKGFGPVNPRLIDSYRLEGETSNWYIFLVRMLQNLFSSLDDVIEKEESRGQHHTELSEENRNLMTQLSDRRKSVFDILENHRSILESVEPHLLNGNVYTKNIILEGNRFVGLVDFQKVLLGDPIDDIAYFSVMPNGEKYVGLILEGWSQENKDSHFEQKLHLYRLLESYRKISTRYVKYRYLQEYPEPLIIAQDELSYYNVK